MQEFVARPATAPDLQKPMHAAGIPTRGVAAAPAHTYANHTASSARKGAKASAESSRTTTVASTPRSRAQGSSGSSELYALAHDFCAGTASSNAKIVSNQQRQVEQRESYLLHTRI